MLSFVFIATNVVVVVVVAFFFFPLSSFSVFQSFVELKAVLAKRPPEGKWKLLNNMEVQ